MPKMKMSEAEKKFRRIHPHARVVNPLKTGLGLYEVYAGLHFYGTGLTKQAAFEHALVKAGVAITTPSTTQGY